MHGNISHCLQEDVSEPLPTLLNEALALAGNLFYLYASTVEIIFITPF